MTCKCNAMSVPHVHDERGITAVTVPVPVPAPVSQPQQSQKVSN